MKLMLSLLIALLSTSVVGVEVMAPYLVVGQSTYALQAEHLAVAWLISVVSVASFASQLGRAEAQHESRVKEIAKRNKQRGEQE